MKNIAISLLAPLVICMGCARPTQNSFQSDSETGVINGTEVSQETAEATGTVSLLIYQTQRDFQRGISRGICTGSLIGRNQVLTAAHCVQDFVKIIVVFKTNLIDQTLTKEDRSFIVTKSIIYPTYNHANCTKLLECVDLAIVKFEKSAPSNYQVAKILGDTQLLTSGASVRPMGFGVSAFDDAKTGGILRQGQIFLKDADLSSDSFRFSQSGIQGICQGDSGGPILSINPVSGEANLIGITSRATKPKKLDIPICNYESLATNVIKYRNWIMAGAQVL